jgi:hypothetical protein
MADSGPAGPLRIEEAMSANTRLPGLQSLAPTGLMDCHLANQSSSSGQHSTPSSPYRRNGSLDPSRVEPGAYKCNSLQFTHFTYLEGASDTNILPSGLPSQTQGET